MKLRDINIMVRTLLNNVEDFDAKNILTEAHNKLKVIELRNLPELTPEEKTLIDQGRKIEAVSQYKYRTRVIVSEAKMKCDEYHFGANYRF